MNPLANLVGPGGGLPPSTLDGMNLVIANQVLGANADAARKGQMIPYPNLTSLKSFFGQRLVSTARVTAGTAFDGRIFQLYTVPKGQQQTEMNGATNYTLQDIDTNMVTASTLPAGEYAWITSIQARVVITGSLDDTTFTGAGLGLANAPGIGTTLVAGDDVVDVNMIQAATESIYLWFSYNGVDFERGPLWAFPTRYLISGVSGGFAYTPTTAGTGIMQNETLLQNGGFSGNVYTLPVVREIQSLYQFSVRLQAQTAFVPTRNFRIQVILEGLGAKAVTG